MTPGGLVEASHTSGAFGNQCSTGSTSHPRTHSRRAPTWQHGAPALRVTRFELLVEGGGGGILMMYYHNTYYPTTATCTCKNTPVLLHGAEAS